MNHLSYLESAYFLHELGEDFILEIVEVVGYVHLVVMRIDEPSLRRAEMVKCVLIEGLLLHQAALRGHPDAVFHGWNLQCPPGVFSGLESLVLVSVVLIRGRECPAGLDVFRESVSAETGDVAFV